MKNSVQSFGAIDISTDRAPLCLKTAAIAALASIMAWALMGLFPNLMVFDPLFVLATAVGIFCSVISLFKGRGFFRLIAALAAAVSFGALIQCVSFFKWAINQP